MYSDLVLEAFDAHHTTTQSSNHLSTRIALWELLRWRLRLARGALIMRSPEVFRIGCLLAHFACELRVQLSGDKMVVTSEF